MGAKSRSATSFTALAHNHYQTMYIGDGATVEFALPTAVQRASDVTGVYVDGARKTLATPGVAHDYAIRGITSGYVGDKNRIKFAAAPGNLKIIYIDTVGG